MKIRIVIFLFIVSSLFAQMNNNINLGDKLVFDPAVKVGKLNNGLSYYIKQNMKPENRVFLRLVVNAGSILEDDNQRGLAHFVEHMAFNGTKNFKKQEIVNYLETIGMKFGADINAYTNFDETVYMLEVPTDSAGYFEKGIEILKEWAHNVSFEDEEIDKERGVVVEEWRIRRGANARIFDKEVPVLLHNSRYADRITIGKKEIIENADYNTVKKFYNDWYRPDLMAVVIVGDIDTAESEALIKKYFSELSNPANQKERKVYEVPDHQETLYSIVSDKEARYAITSMYCLQEKNNVALVKDYLEKIKSNLFNGMFSSRMQEIIKEADAPFVAAYGYKYNMTRSKGTYRLMSVDKEDDILKGFKRLLIEAEKVKRYGFTEAEFDRQKKIMSRGMQQYYNERDKLESGKIISQYAASYLNDETVLSPEFEYELFNKLIDNISLEDVNELSNKFIANNNRIITVSLPEKDNIKIPTQEDISNLVAEISKLEIDKYSEEVSEEPLVSKLPEAGKVIDEIQIDSLDITVLKLSNGAKAYLKQTDFKNDEILFAATSPGGHSLSNDKNYVSSYVSSYFIGQSGLSSFNQTELQKKLAGKIVNVNPYISELNEGLNGRCSPEDIETLFQLIYLNFTEPKKDSTAFLAALNRIQTSIKNKSNDPTSVYQDSIMVTMSNYNFRARPVTEEMLKEINLDTAYSFYKNRFTDASDFTFIFVGNFDKQKLVPYIEQYLASLPSLNRKESWRDVGIEAPKGIISKKIYKGIEPKSRVDIKFTGDLKFSKDEDFAFDAMAEYLRIKLREVLREDKGGTYGVGVWGNIQKVPKEDYTFNVSFGCDPNRVEELTNEVMIQLDSLKNFAPAASYLTKIKEGKLRTNEEQRKQNSFWLNRINYYISLDMDLLEMLEFEDMVKKIKAEDILNIAKKSINTENYKRFVLYPENYN